MSSITGLSSNFGSQSLALAMTKRANDAQGQQAMQLLNGAAQSVQQIQAASPAVLSLSFCRSPASLRQFLIPAGGFNILVRRKAALNFNPPAWRLRDTASPRR